MTNPILCSLRGEQGGRGYAELVAFYVNEICDGSPGETRRRAEAQDPPPIAAPDPQGLDPGRLGEGPLGRRESLGTGARRLSLPGPRESSWALLGPAPRSSSPPHGNGRRSVRPRQPPNDLRWPSSVGPRSSQGGPRIRSSSVCSQGVRRWPLTAGRRIGARKLARADRTAPSPRPARLPGARGRGR